MKLYTRSICSFTQPGVSRFIKTNTLSVKPVLDQTDINLILMNTSLYF